MSFYYDYYIGNSRLAFNNISKQNPSLLTLSKVRGGDKNKHYKHLHAHLEMFYFESGKGVFEFEGKEYPIIGDYFAVIDANRMHWQYSTDTADPLTYYCLSIDSISFQGFEANCLSLEGMLLHKFDSDDNPIHNGILRLMDELKLQQYDYHSKVNAIFHELLVDTLRLYPAGNFDLNYTEKVSSKSSPVNNAKLYIDKHYTEDITLDFLAKMSFMNKSYFLSQFKKQFNISPMQYLTLVKLEHSKLLLTKTDLSITEIASSLLFNSSSYYSEIFKKNFGISPSNFRKFIRSEK